MPPTRLRIRALPPPTPPGRRVFSEGERLRQAFTPVQASKRVDEDWVAQGPEPPALATPSSTMAVLGAPDPLNYVFFVGRRRASIGAPSNVTVSGLACPLVSVNGVAEPEWAAWLEADSDTEEVAPLLDRSSGLVVEYLPLTGGRGNGQAGKRDTTFRARVYNAEPYPVPLSNVSLTYWFHGGNLFCGATEVCTEDKTRFPWMEDPVYPKIHTGEVNQCGVQPTGDIRNTSWAAPVSLVSFPCDGVGGRAGSPPPLVVANASVAAAPREEGWGDDARLALDVSFNGSSAWLAPAGWPGEEVGDQESEDDVFLELLGGDEDLGDISDRLVSYVEVEASIVTGKTLGIVLNMSEEEDYSYVPSRNSRWQSNQRLAGYVNGELLWGIEPGVDDRSPGASAATPCPSPEQLRDSNITDLLDGVFQGCNLVAQYCCLNETFPGYPPFEKLLPSDGGGSEGGNKTDDPTMRIIDVDGNSLKVSWWAFLILGLGVLAIGAGVGIMIFKRVMRRRDRGAAGDGRSFGGDGKLDNSPQGVAAKGAWVGKGSFPKGDASSSSLEVELQTSPGAKARDGSAVGILSNMLKVNIPEDAVTATMTEAWLAADRPQTSPSVVLAELESESPDPDEFLASWLERIGAHVVPPSPTPALVSPQDVATGGKNFLDVDTHKIQLLAQIGSGAHGNVYEAAWVDHGNMRVAVKVLNEVSFVGGERASESKLLTLKTEVSLLSRLEHPNIVKLLGACLAPPRICIVEELLDKSLLDLIAERRGSGLDFREILEVGNQVAAALAYLHPTVVHRDLKPANVLVDRNGRYKVADFGIARCKSSTYLVTTEGTGTPAYMAPELFGEERACEKVDVYSLGMVLWQCLTGKTPWNHLTVPFQVVMLVGIEQKRPDMPKDCPPALRSLIEKCWDGDPRRRPSCAEIEKRTRLLLEQGAP